MASSRRHHSIVAASPRDRRRGDTVASPPRHRRPGCARYPHEPPKVHCDTKIFHPNINLEGNVCLNILRQDWKPVLDINAVIYGLIYLFYEPNPDDPLNKEAAALYRDDIKMFERHVSRTLPRG